MKSERFVKCLLCGNKAEIKQRSFPGYQEPDLFDIYHCPTCNTAFSFPVVETSKIYENIYKNGKIVTGYDRYWRYAEMVKNCKNPLASLSEAEETYWAVKEAISNIVTDIKTTKILEIGSGLGYLTYSLIRANYDAIGIDISETAVRQAIKNFGNHFICTDLFEFARNNAEPFDVIVLTEVIEHINNPLDFIESIKKLLKQGGYAIITTPNKSLFPKDIIWATDLPPVHCWWFSEDSMNFIGKEKDLNIEFLNFRKYYQKNPFTFDLKEIRNGKFEHSTLNCNGELADRLIKRKSNKLLKIRSRIYRIAFFKRIYNYLMRITIADGIACNDRGQMLCAIMKKSR